MVRDFAEVPRDAERVIFFPPGGRGLSDGRGRATRARADARGRRRPRLRGLRAARLRLGHRRATRRLRLPRLPAIGRWSPTTPRPGELLAEYCVGFDDEGERLPPADDVLAKWMTPARARVRPDRRRRTSTGPATRSIPTTRRATSPASCACSARRARALDTGRLPGLPAQADRLLRHHPQRCRDRSASCSPCSPPVEPQPAFGERLPDADDVLAKWMCAARRRARS